VARVRGAAARRAAASSGKEGSDSSGQGGAGTPLSVSQGGTRSRSHSNSLSAIRLTCSASNEPLPPRALLFLLLSPAAGRGLQDRQLASLHAQPAGIPTAHEQGARHAWAATAPCARCRRRTHCWGTLGVCPAVCPMPCWLEGQPEAHEAVGSLLEDFLVRKLIAQLVRERARGPEHAA